MGFLKFLLAIGLVIAGIIGIIWAFASCSLIGASSAMSGKYLSTAPSWILGIISFVVGLGGVYMLRRK
jgi:hypothetical protein